MILRAQARSQAGSRARLLVLAFAVLATVPAPGKTQEVDARAAGCLEWTQWLNRDRPSGQGDYETLAEHRKRAQICPQPQAIQCQTTDGRDWTTTEQVYTCDPNVGGVCINAEQAAGERCLDYRVRLCCQSSVMPGVTEAERQMAIQLAQGAMKKNGLPTSGRMYATEVSLLDGKDKGVWQDRSGKRVFVVHFRYEDLSAILSTVDLSHRRVTEQRQAFGYSTDISPEEIQHAREQVLRHPVVRKILAKVEGKFDAYIFPVARTALGRARDGTRGVRFSFFEIVGAYRQPIPKLGSVHFDLLTGRVLIEGEGTAS